MIIFLDESGFTGEDLSNPGQPIFVLASTDFSDAEADKLKLDVFGAAHTDELKHHELMETAEGRRQIVEAVRRMAEQPDRFATYVVHKRFTLMAKWVDLWLESAARADGVDIYSGDQAKGFANLMFWCLNTLEGEETVAELSKAFQDMVRFRSRDLYDGFWSHVRTLINKATHQSRDLLEPFMGLEVRLGFKHLSTLGDRPLDVARAAAFMTVAYWRSRTDARFRLLHDESSNMATAREIWDELTSPLFKPMDWSISDRNVRFPLNVERSDFDGKSQLHSSLQVCDVLAGATAFWARKGLGDYKRKQHVGNLDLAGIAGFIRGGIWPEAPGLD